MKHLFRATKIGWEKEKKVYGLILMPIPKKKQKRSSSHIKELRSEVIPILVTNVMGKSIMM